MSKFVTLKLNALEKEGRKVCINVDHINSIVELSQDTVIIFMAPSLSDSFNPIRYQFKGSFEELLKQIGV